MRTNELNKIIYSMIKVSKNIKKTNIKKIYFFLFLLSKIAVLGLNGSGKSTLLRILAGIDQEFDGKTVMSDGFTIDYLPQEPVFDADKTVREGGGRGSSDNTGFDGRI